MAKCTVQTKEVPITVMEEEESYVLTLNKEEAMYVRKLISTVHEVGMTNIWTSLAISLDSEGITLYESAKIFRTNGTVYIKKLQETNQ
jgi:hypothetical protein